MGNRITVVLGDITGQRIDAIVNSATRSHEHETR
jgi:O-acetyl-ADP-ribose deacetylase (regulator of RNase III)